MSTSTRQASFSSACFSWATCCSNFKAIREWAVEVKQGNNSNGVTRWVSSRKAIVQEGGVLFLFLVTHSHLTGISRENSLFRFVFSSF